MYSDDDYLARFVVGTIIAQRLVFTSPGGTEATYPHLEFFYDAAGVTFGLVYMEAAAPPANDISHPKLTWTVAAAGNKSLTLNTGQASGGVGEASSFSMSAVNAAAGGSAAQALTAVTSATHAAGLQLLANEAPGLGSITGTINGATRIVVTATGLAITGALSITTALTVPNGGTGVATLAAGYVKSNGVAAFTSQATPIPIADGGTGTNALAAGQFVLGDAAALQTQSGINNTDLNNSAPTSYTPVFAGFTIGNGTVAGGYTLLGPLCFWFAYYKIGSTDTKAATTVTVTLPVNARVNATDQVLAGAVEGWAVNASISATNFNHITGKYGTTTMELEALKNNANGVDDTNTFLANDVASTPFAEAFGTGDIFYLKGWFWRA